MNFVFGQDEFIAKYVGDALGLVFSGPYVAIGFVDEAGTLRGGAVFNNYNKSNIDLTIYCPGVTTRGLIRVVMHYVFVQLKCNRMTGRTRLDNKNTQKLLPRLGFKYEATQKQYYGPDKNDAAVMYMIDRETAVKRWLNGLS